MSLAWSMRFLKKGKAYYILGLLLIILDSFSKVYLEWVQKKAIDVLFVGQQEALFFSIMIELAFVWLLPCLLFFGFSMFCNKAAFELNENLVKETLTHILRLPKERYEMRKIGEYTNILNYDIEKVSSSVAYTGIPFLVEGVVGILFVAVAMYIISPMALITALVVSMVYVGISIKFSSAIKNESRQVRESHNKLLSSIEESVSGTKEIIAFNKSIWIKNLIDIKFENYYRASMKECKVINNAMLVGLPLKWSLSLIILSIGAFGIIDGSVSIGGFVILYQYTSLLLASLQSVYDSIVKLGSANASSEILNEIHGEEQEGYGHYTLENIENIVLKNVNFRYSGSEQDTLKNLSFKLKGREKIAIIGESGSGKSTVAKLLVRLLNPCSGEIMINGNAIENYSESDFISVVRYVAQEPHIYPDSIYDNIVLGNINIPIQDVVAISQDMRILDYIDNLPNGFETILGDNGSTISSGQRQRLAITRAMLHKPELLVFDESTSALDIENEAKIIETIDQYRLDKTTIYIAHRLSTILNADQIIVMHDGECIAQGKHHELYRTNDIYKRMIDEIS
ncbi:ABC transporter ATP-binding protein [Fusibacter sp. 3D3]|uniref:ABC transporter ATP-binding protein n=1 Tax=Fusibacter sp. 3D3 TaxID=1048380 RepID=UPI0008532332|nr:ABC transporter ATP-binding protein [Fusibacter sp. 3D3]GAU75463.1 autoinducer 2 ABC transport system [Fusibacter sp. 3D3]